MIRDRAMISNIRTVSTLTLNTAVPYILIHSYDPKYKECLYINFESERSLYLGT